LPRSAIDRQGAVVERIADIKAVLGSAGHSPGRELTKGLRHAPPNLLAEPLPPRDAPFDAVGRDRLEAQELLGRIAPEVMTTPIGEFIDPPESHASVERPARRRGAGRTSAGRLLDLKAAEVYSGISAWTLRDLIASGDLPAGRPPRLRRVWIDRADLDRAIADWKERAGS
jgi:hypothetical protein